MILDFSNMKKMTTSNYKAKLKATIKTTELKQMVHTELVYEVLDKECLRLQQVKCFDIDLISGRCTIISKQK